MNEPNCVCERAGNESRKKNNFMFSNIRNIKKRRKMHRTCM